MKTLLLIAASLSLSALTSCTTVVAPEKPAVTETQVSRTSTSSTYGAMPTSTTTETHSVVTE